MTTDTEQTSGLAKTILVKFLTTNPDVLKWQRAFALAQRRMAEAEALAEGEEVKNKPAKMTRPMERVDTGSKLIQARQVAVDCGYLLSDLIALGYQCTNFYGKLILPKEDDPNPKQKVAVVFSLERDLAEDDEVIDLYEDQLPEAIEALLDTIEDGTRDGQDLTWSAVWGWSNPGEDTPDTINMDGAMTHLPAFGSLRATTNGLHLETTQQLIQEPDDNGKLQNVVHILEEPVTCSVSAAKKLRKFYERGRQQERQQRQANQAR